MEFNSIKLPIGSIFYTTQPFMKKLTTVKTLGEKKFSFEIRNYAMEWCYRKNQVKKVFSNKHLLKVLKLLVFVSFSFFIILIIMVKTFFQEQRCLI